MLAEGLVDYLIIDSTWAGGLTTWRKAAVMAELYQVPLPWFELFRERPAIVDGMMAAPETPGLGLELRPETLEKYGVKI